MRRAVSFFGGIILGIIIVCTLGRLLASTSPNFIFRSPPTDDQMIDNFNHHKVEFNQLAQMLLTEKELLVIFPDSGHCQIERQKLVDSSENERCAEYVRLFKLLGLHWAYSGGEPLRLTVFSSGLAISGMEKGYYFTSALPTQLGTVVSNTDIATGLPLPLFRHIEESWYIFFDGD